MNEELEKYWKDIPVGKKQAIEYAELMLLWKTTERQTRAILHKLSAYDNGDNYILIRSSKSKGFFKSDDPEVLQKFRQECLNKGRSIFAPVKKINRVLRSQNNHQYSLINNLKQKREDAGFTQQQVCDALYHCGYGLAIDTSLLSKMENGVCCPTPFQMQKLAELYKTEPDDLFYMIEYRRDDSATQ